MAQTSSWDDMKRAREEEYFLRDERAKIAALKANREEKRAFLCQTHVVIRNFGRGFSPISGGSIFRAYIGDDVVLDCPEEGALTIPYDTLEKLIKEAGKPESEMHQQWLQFLEVALDSTEENTGEEEDAS